MTPRPAWGSYSEEEIEALVEGYEELVYKKDKPAIFVRILDLERALRSLNSRERGAVVLVGIVGLTNEAAGRLLEVSETAVRKRYRAGLESIYDFLNGAE